MLKLEGIIEEYNHYANNSLKFKEYQRELHDFRKIYRLSNLKNFDQDKIYPIEGNREGSFLRKICKESLMGTKVGPIFSNIPKFFKKLGTLDKFIFFLKELLKIKKDDFNNSFYKIIIINNNHFKTLSTLKTVLIQIISCYFPEHFFPIYQLEGIIPALKEYGINTTKINLNNTETLGQNIFRLNKILRELKLKNSLTKEWSNVVFTHFLFTCFPLKTVEILRNFGFKFLERNEQFVVALFSKLHQKLDFKRIIRIKPEFPDAEVEDNKGDIKNIEFEYDAIKFESHIKKEEKDKNYHKKCDIIICWSDNSKPKLRKIIKDSGIVVKKLEDITNPKSELYRKIFG